MSDMASHCLVPIIPSHPLAVRNVGDGDIIDMWQPFHILRHLSKARVGSDALDAVLLGDNDNDGVVVDDDDDDDDDVVSISPGVILMSLIVVMSVAVH